MRRAAQIPAGDGHGLEASIDSVRRSVYLFALPIAIVGLAVMTLLEVRSGGGVEATFWAYPLSLLFAAGSFLAIWRRWLPLRALEYAMVSAFILAALALLVAPNIGSGHSDEEGALIIGAMGYWLPVLYGLIFMVFGSRIGAGISIAVWSATVAVGASHLLWPGDHAEHDLMALAQTYISNLLVIIVLIGAAEILQRRARHSDRLQEEVHTDALTGLPNRRLLTRLIGEEMARSERYHRPFAIVLFDLDHFKMVNDNFGHPVGDEVLKRIGPMLAKHVRETDTLGRWGGEEFMVLLPEMDMVAGARMAERLRKVVEGGTFPKGIRMTASFGVARFWKGDSMASFLERVDRALYSAKDGGRNRVVPPPE